MTTLKGRCIYVWQLDPVLKAELGIESFVRKAVKAQFSSVWIKVAEGGRKYKNLSADMEIKFRQVVEELNREGIDVWGWHVPYAATTESAKAEAELVASIAKEFNLSGILMDAEAGAKFFKGNANTAEIYAENLKIILNSLDKGLAISSHDIPSNFPDFPFDSFAKHATINAPQVYYGGSSSVSSRLNRAIDANDYLDIPFVPVGAAWIGDGGGCASASACAERALAFMDLVRAHNFQGYSFWHWQSVPSKLWEIFFTHSATDTEVLEISTCKDNGCIEKLISCGRNNLVEAQKIAKASLKQFPHKGCAANLSALMQLAGIDIPMILGAGKLARCIEQRGWIRIEVGKQQAGDVGVTFDNCEPSGADHIYLVLEAMDNDKMLIVDNQDNVPHSRYASGHGKTPTEYFLRAV